MEQNKFVSNFNGQGQHCNIVMELVNKAGMSKREDHRHTGEVVSDSYPQGL